MIPLKSETVSYRDRISTIDESGKRKWVRAKKPKGKFYDKRTLLSFFYLAIFFIMPFIRFHDRPFMLLNLIERKFILFSFVFWPQDLIIFGLMMITGVVFIAFFTVIYGRIFCGWVCPQTVFMELVFRKIEYFFEGNHQQQVELQLLPWGWEKFRKKGVKHIVFWGLSFLIANTFLAYIIGTDALFHIIKDPVSSHLAGFLTIAAFTTVFYTVFTFVREQVCTIVCPYGRLQGVLTDSDTILVSYDYSRGEPRGMTKKNQVSDKGDCIDCKECVKVCPTGIDIRNGAQLECINCTACIDACEAIMIRMERPTGLIRYASENNIKSNTKFTFSWRIKAYTSILCILLILVGSLLFTRKNIDSTIVRAGGLLTQTMADGRIANLYKIKLVNKTYHDIEVDLKLENVKGEIKYAGKGLSAKKESIADDNFFIILDPNTLQKRKNFIKVGIYHNGIKIEEIETTFLIM
ncbi:MAG: cytochrome c oxidase accessory protein CcoG [Candidatus Kapabacteria bacterium]|nr:cytochrome c oxidase accessory protein CcoG [Candidatus Kapabacteria bacterium]